MKLINFSESMSTALDIRLRIELEQIFASKIKLLKQYIKI